jgi:hypothetical protein
MPTSMPHRGGPDNPCLWSRRNLPVRAPRLDAAALHFFAHVSQSSKVHQRPSGFSDRANAAGVAAGPLDTVRPVLRRRAGSLSPCGLLVAIFIGQPDTTSTGNKNQGLMGGVAGDPQEPLKDGRSSFRGFSRQSERRGADGQSATYWRGRIRAVCTCRRSLSPLSKPGTAWSPVHFCGVCAGLLQSLDGLSASPSLMASA